MGHLVIITTFTIDTVDRPPQPCYPLFSEGRGLGKRIRLFVSPFRHVKVGVFLPAIQSKSIYVHAFRLPCLIMLSPYFPRVGRANTPAKPPPWKKKTTPFSLLFSHRRKGGGAVGRHGGREHHAALLLFADHSADKVVRDLKTERTKHANGGRGVTIQIVSKVGMLGKYARGSCREESMRRKRLTSVVSNKMKFWIE